MVCALHSAPLASVRLQASTPLHRGAYRPPSARGTHSGDVWGSRALSGRPSTPGTHLWTQKSVDTAGGNTDTWAHTAFGVGAPGPEDLRKPLPPPSWTVPARTPASALGPGGTTSHDTSSYDTASGEYAAHAGAAQHHQGRGGAPPGAERGSARDTNSTPASELTPWREGSAFEGMDPGFYNGDGSAFHGSPGAVGLQVRPALL